MGLDMYLVRTIRVPGWKPEDYRQADDVVGSEVLKKPDGPPIVVVDAATGKVSLHDLPLGTLEKARLLAPLEVREAVRVRGENFQWFSIFEEVAYWRKVNAVHAWFVDIVQGGVDECQLTEVSKAQLEALLDLCREVLTKGYSEQLPPRSGFFFGSTATDEWYLSGILDTVVLLTKVIQTTDFEKQIVFYEASW